MMESSLKYGFIIVDGNGALIASVQGNTQTILARYSVTLPKKHRRGGQSSVRFARLRVEARHNYLTKVNEMALKCFLNSDNKVNVNGLILAGSADFKDQFNKTRLDIRLQPHVLTILDVAYGFTQGLHQAIAQSSDILHDLLLVQQKKLFSRFFDEINQNTDKYCYGVSDTLAALESGAVETTLVWDKLNIVRHTVINSATGESKIVFSKGEESPHDQQDDKFEVIDSTPLIDWLAENYKEFGTSLEIVQDSSGEGSQFCQGFGGIGGLLRYQMSFSHGKEEEEEEQINSDEDDLSEYFLDPKEDQIFCV